MKRRDFINLSTFAAVAIGLPALSSCNATGTEQGLSEPLFLSRLFTPAQLTQVGKVYIEKRQRENDKDKLIKLLSDEGSIAKSTDKKLIQQYLDKKVKHDFESGNTVLLRGWVLSVTEARQCALYSLVNG